MTWEQVIVDDRRGDFEIRLHLDLRPDDQGAEVVRLLALGATRVEGGRRRGAAVVLADPEGNELCVSPAGGGGGPGHDA